MTAIYVKKKNKKQTIKKNNQKMHTVGWTAAFSFIMMLLLGRHGYRLLTCQHSDSSLQTEHAKQKQAEYSLDYMK